MTSHYVSTTIQILGKGYQIKCLESEVKSLQQAAQFLQERMRILRDSAHTLSFDRDRIAVITGLNLVHDLLNYDQKKENDLQNIRQRMQDLQEKIDVSLAKNAQLEMFAENGTLV